MIRPTNISLLDWAASLIVDFPSENVPQLFEESNWKNWGNELLSLSGFAQKNIPPTDGFDDWVEWAERLYGILD